MYQPVIDQNRCTLCGECFDFDCPGISFKEIKGKISTINIDICIGCNFCVVNCPAHAIKISNKESKKNKKRK
jgi:Pyruvate/2-oxoacid:ferredoxin oxidoreductase delta subunit